MVFDRDRLKTRAAELAAQGVYLGTSSWKYPGWRGMLYDEARYVWRGKFANSRFEKNCLGEYAGVFKTVCVDAAYYNFPTAKYLDGLVAQVPGDFLFGFKVTDEITVKKFPNLPRFGQRAGLANQNFLNADLFSSAFARAFEPIRPHVGLFMFEFSKFHPGDYEHGRDFLADLDTFLGRIPKGWPCGVEIRNKNFLRPEYFALLHSHGVAHIFNSWTDMPGVAEQLALPGSLTSPDLAGARFLLKPGKKYQEAVDQFSPYSEVKEPCPEARAAGAELIRRAADKSGRRKLFLYVNNRLEGNALLTLQSMMEE